MAHDRTRPDTGRVRRLPDGGDHRSIQFQFSVPGAVVPVADVTLVSVLPTHRRRGILRSMMRRQLSDIAERGESLLFQLADSRRLRPRVADAACGSGSSTCPPPYRPAATRPRPTWSSRSVATCSPPMRAAGA